MSTAKKTAATRKDVYQIVTDRMIEMIDANEIPWRKPWVSASQGARAGAPKSAISGKEYRGANAFFLAMAGIRYTAPFWLTFNQAKKAKGAVKKGEKSTLVILWKWFEVEEKDANGKPKIGANGKPKRKRVPMLRYFNVFNVDQVDWSKAPKGEPKKVRDWREAEEAAKVAQAKSKTERAELQARRNEAAEEILSGYLGRENAPTFNEVPSGKAFYAPALDSITVPLRAQFPSLPEFYSTAFHEAAHSTGHESRLDRLEDATFGDHAYSREELVAEFTATLLISISGIEDTRATENSAAYLANWKKKLKEDPKALVIAAAQAQKAADLILGEEAPTGTEEE